MTKPELNQYGVEKRSPTRADESGNALFGCSVVGLIVAVVLGLISVLTVIDDNKAKALDPDRHFVDLTGPGTALMFAIPLAVACLYGIWQGRQKGHASPTEFDEKVSERAGEYLQGKQNE